MGEQQQNPCVMAKCSTDYFHRLARSRFTLAPAGDKPWSQRFFEAIMAGSVPILQLPQHAGRNLGEQTLGYKFLLVSEFENRLRANEGGCRTAATGPKTTWISFFAGSPTSSAVRPSTQTSTGAGARRSIDRGLRMT